MHDVFRVGQLLGDRLFAPDPVVAVDVGGVAQKIDDAAELGLFADRQLERCDAGAEQRAQLVERAIEAGALTVELVDEDHAGEVERGRRFPCDFGLHLDAFHGADDDDGEVGHGQPGLHLREEVGVARTVEQIELAAVRLERRQ